MIDDIEFDDDIIEEMKIAEAAKVISDPPVRNDVIIELEAYAYNGRQLGGFLTKVMSNDLFGALGYADEYNRMTIYKICHFIYNELPAGCWGSPEIVAAHYRRFKTRQQIESGEL